MKLDQEQRTQFIVLCILLVVVIGFGAYRMMGTDTSANSPAETAKKPVRTAGQAVPEQPEAQVAKAAGYVKPAKDPFQPQVLDGDLEIEETEETLPAPKMTFVAQEPSMPLPMMPAFDPGPVRMPSAPQAAEPEVDPTKDLKLTGVVEGDVNVAVIRRGDARHIVREGQSIDGRLVVRSITRSGVRLSCNGRSYYLVLSSGKES